MLPFTGVDNRFKFRINTTNTSIGSSSSNQFRLPILTNIIGINFIINWGDGTSNVITDPNQAEVLHTYASSGIYDVNITGVNFGWSFVNDKDRLKMLNISNWGTFNISAASTFWGCSNMTITATDYPIISSASLAFTFASCSSITSIDLSGCDTSSVNGGPGMFSSCRAMHTCNVSTWNTSGFLDVSSMFINCTSLLSLNLTNWNVSNIINLSTTFRNCIVLTTIGDVSGWNTFNVNTMFRLFFGCRNLSLNGIQNWNVSNVLTMQELLRDADLFTASLANWDINQVTTFLAFMSFATGMTTANYDATLISWNNQVPKNNINIDFGGSKYTLGSAAAAARQNLITTYNWTIADGGGI